MSFASVYPHYIQKAEKKNRTKAEVDEIIFWLTGYDELALQQIIDNKTDFESFFARAPQINPNVSKITGVICGYRVEEIEDKLMQKVRYLDKLIDDVGERASVLDLGCGTAMPMMKYLSDHFPIMATVMINK